MVYVPLVHFQAHHRYPCIETHAKVAGYFPEKQIISIFSVLLDGEENFQLIIAEQYPPPVECFVNGAASTQDVTPVPKGVLALPLIDPEGAAPL